MRLILTVLLNLIVINCATGAGPEIEWTSKMKRELFSIYYKTSPDEPGHTERMKQKWDQKFPQYRDVISGEELRQHAIKWIKEICDPIINEPRFWRSELNEKVLRYFYQTNPNWKFHEARMRNLWDRDFPYFTAEANDLQLRDHAYKLLGRMHGVRKEVKPKFSWPSNITEDILSIYYSTPRNEMKHAQRVKEKFDLKFPQYKDKVTVDALRHHIRILIERKRERGQAVTESSNAKGKRILDQSNDASTSTSKNKKLNENYFYNPIDMDQLLSQHQEIHPVTQSDMYHNDPSTSRQTRHFDLNEDPIDEHEQSDSSH